MRAQLISAALTVPPTSTCSDELLEMLSTGFCDKQNKIGEYGNGLKSSSMRIGDDCLVFTFHAETRTFSVGLYRCKSRLSPQDALA